MAKRVISIGSDGTGQVETRSSKELDSKPDAYVFILLDCSPSMENDGKLEKAKKGCVRYASEAISKGYAIGIITFSYKATLISNKQIRNTEEVVALLERVRIEGATCLAPALEMATELLGHLPGTRVIFIATDGQTMEPELTLSLGETAKKKGIYIKTLGTKDADREFLRKLASSKKFSLSVQDENIGEAIADAASLLPPANGNYIEG